MAGVPVTKSNLYFQNVRLFIAAGEFTSEIDAWDLPTEDIVKLDAKETELLEVHGYADFDTQGNVVKIFGMQVYNGNKGIPINPTKQLLDKLEEEWAYSMMFGSGV